MSRLKSVALFWHNATRAYLLTKLYAIDGAPVTRANVTDALKALGETGDSKTLNDGLGVLRVGRTAFARTLHDSLEHSQKNALLLQALVSVTDLAAMGHDVLAANALLQILNSDRLKPHLSKQNQAIGEIASSLRAFGGLSPNLAVMRHGDGRWLIEKVTGRWSYVIGPDRPCLYLDFVGGPLERPADYVLSFEYFDRGDWKLHFHYDSDYPPDQKRQYHPVEPLQLTDTKTWKKGSFLLTNCLFSSGQNNLADMRFVTPTLVFERRRGGARIRNIRLKPK